MSEMTIRRGPLIERKRAKRTSRLQRSFLFIGILFVVGLGTSVAYRSLTRRSIFSSSGEKSREAERESELHLQDFSRIQVKDGRQIWQVKATDAKYFAKENLTHVHNAKVTVFRDKQPPVFIVSRTAKLLLDGEALTRADLDGNVEVSLRDGLKLVTAEATYDAAEGTVTSPAHVEITGKGMDVTGKGMKLWVETEVFELLDAVDSRFEQGASVPKIRR